jgi:hypothetical protein
MLAMSLAGCSTMADLGGVPRPGYQNDGSFVLTAEEQGLGCRELQARQASVQTQLQQLPSKAVEEMQQFPKTVANAWSRLVGSEDQGAPSLAAYNEAKAESAALSESLHRKGCNGPSVETASIKR